MGFVSFYIIRGYDKSICIKSSGDMESHSQIYSDLWVRDDWRKYNMGEWLDSWLRPVVYINADDYLVYTEKHLKREVHELDIWVRETYPNRQALIDYLIEDTLNDNRTCYCIERHSTVMSKPYSYLLMRCEIVEHFMGVFANQGIEIESKAGMNDLIALARSRRMLEPWRMFYGRFRERYELLSRALGRKARYKAPEKGLVDLLGYVAPCIQVDIDIHVLEEFFRHGLGNSNLCNDERKWVSNHIYCYLKGLKGKGKEEEK